MRLHSLLLLLLPLAAPAVAQDSVSRLPGLPGDATVPWWDSGSPQGSEQRDAYVVTLREFQTSWGTTFGLAPVLKSSKTGATFFGSLFSSQAISRKVARDVPFHSGQYLAWRGPGFGVNNNRNVSRRGRVLTAPPGPRSHQVALAAAEFATTDPGFSYNGVVGAIVNILPSDPRFLAVTRYVAAINSCNTMGDVSQLAIGAVDEAGSVTVRADDFTVVGGGCGLSILLGNNIFRVDMASRNATTVNVLSGDFPGGLFDAPATRWIIRNDGTSYNTPCILPASVSGGQPIYLGSNFNTQYVRGRDFGLTVADSTHLAPGLLDHRGNVSYSSDNCAQLGSTHGVAGLIGRDANDLATVLNVWGLDANADVTGVLGLQLPATITDNATGVSNLPGINEFDHYHSQVAFRGGNGQVALGTDQQGNLLAAAVADHPDYGGPAWEYNYVAVARLDCSTGNVDWTMAGYTTNGTGAPGKPILDGPGGNVIGQMTPYFNVPPGVFVGPSMSAPMIDSVGNIYFLASIELFGAGGSTFHVALLRAVYDPAAFSYELELLFKVGDEFVGVDSGTRYRLVFMPVADSNSIDSASAWSGNIVEDAHLGQNSATLAPADPRTLGGMVVHAAIIYDVNNDGLFEDPTDPNGNPLSPDQAYNVLLYVGSVEP